MSKRKFDITTKFENNFEQGLEDYQEQLYDIKEYREQLEKERKNSNNLMMYTFGNRLKKFRKKKGFTQKEISMKLGAEISTYANWEQGRRSPGIYDIWNITQELEISANDLFEGLLEDMLKGNQ